MTKLSVIKISLEKESPGCWCRKGGLLVSIKRKNACFVFRPKYCTRPAFVINSTHRQHDTEKSLIRQNVIEACAEKVLKIHFILVNY